MGANLIGLLYVLQLQPAQHREFLLHWAAIPAQLSLESTYTLFSTQLIHVGVAHCLGNLLFLWVFGSAVEAQWGAREYLALYWVGGTLALLAQMATHPASTLPIVGASGAISTLLGAYAIQHPNARITTWWGLTCLEVPAKLYLGFWVGLQVAGWYSTSTTTAYTSHLVGFLVGLLWGMTQ